MTVSLEVECGLCGRSGIRPSIGEMGEMGEMGEQEGYWKSSVNGACGKAKGWICHPCYQRDEDGEQCSYHGYVLSRIYIWRQEQRTRE